jgi:hypothetical protein
MTENPLFRIRVKKAFKYVATFEAPPPVTECDEYKIFTLDNVDELLAKLRDAYFDTVKEGKAPELFFLPEIDFLLAMDAARYYRKMSIPHFQDGPLLYCTPPGKEQLFFHGIQILAHDGNEIIAGYDPHKSL